MDRNMEILLSKIDEKLEMKLAQQASIISSEVSKNVMNALDERIQTLMEENNALKNRVSILEHKLEHLEKDKRQYNLVFFGMEEKGKNERELGDHIKDTIEDIGVQLDSTEIANVRRIGKNSDKSRPVLVTFTSKWKKHLIQINKSRLPEGVYVKEDYPKEVLETRKKLQNQLKEEQAKGNVAYLKYDKLIVKKPQDGNREKRKRGKTDSPIERQQPKKQDTQKESTKPSILNYVARGRTPYTSESTSKN